MNKKYSIGNFTAQIKSAVDFTEDEKYSLFSYKGNLTDYEINVSFSDNFPKLIKRPIYETADRVYLAENGAMSCYYKSRENNQAFFAIRNSIGNSVNILIDSKYRGLLRSDVILSLAGIEELVIKNNGCIIHSSYIVKNNSAILFTGPSTIGKSTQARLWKQYADAVIVNGDKALISNINGDIIASGLPFSGSSKDCLNIAAPLKAIICLNKGKENILKRIYPPQSFYNIYKNCYPVPYSEKLTEKLIDIITDIAKRIPVYEFTCLPDESAVSFLQKELYELIFT